MILELFIFLRVIASQVPEGLFLNRQHYIHPILKRTNLLEAKLVKSLRCPTNKLTRFDQESFDDPKLFRSTLGALQYLSITRPDISFIVNRVRQFLHNLCTPHWTVVKRILWYLKHTIHFGLLFRQSRSSCLCAYSVADWAGCTSDGRSTVRYCIFLGHNLTLWSSKKQITASHSSTEAKYKVVANTADELICIQSLLTELGVLILLSNNLLRQYRRYISHIQHGIPCSN